MTSQIGPAAQHTTWAYKLMHILTQHSTIKQHKTFVVLRVSHAQQPTTTTLVARRLQGRLGRRSLRLALLLLVVCSSYSRGLVHPQFSHGRWADRREQGFHNGPNGRFHVVHGLGGFNHMPGRAGTAQTRVHVAEFQKALPDDGLEITLFVAFFAVADSLRA